MHWFLWCLAGTEGCFQHLGRTSTQLLCEFTRSWSQTLRRFFFYCPPSHEGGGGGVNIWPQWSDHKRSLSSVLICPYMHPECVSCDHLGWNLPHYLQIILFSVCDDQILLCWASLRCACCQCVSVWESTESGGAERVNDLWNEIFPIGKYNRNHYVVYSTVYKLVEKILKLP